MNFEEASELCDKLRQYEDKSGENYSVLGPHRKGDEAIVLVGVPAHGSGVFIAPQLIHVAAEYECHMTYVPDEKQVVLAGP